jgi:hypothetical protein
VKEAIDKAIAENPSMSHDAIEEVRERVRENPDMSHDAIEEVRERVRNSRLFAIKLFAAKSQFGFSFSSPMRASLPPNSIRNSKFQSSTQQMKIQNPKK